MHVVFVLHRKVAIIHQQVKNQKQGFRLLKIPYADVRTVVLFRFVLRTEKNQVNARFLGIAWFVVNLFVCN